jgi:hypothetical protein
MDGNGLSWLTWTKVWKRPNMRMMRKTRSRRIVEMGMRLMVRARMESRTTICGQVGR